MIDIMETGKRVGAYVAMTGLTRRFLLQARPTMKTAILFPYDAVNASGCSRIHARRAAIASAVYTLVSVLQSSSPRVQHSSSPQCPAVPQNCLNLNYFGWSRPYRAVAWG
jgi:hypothetical protein